MHKNSRNYSVTDTRAQPDRQKSRHGLHIQSSYFHLAKTNLEGKTEEFV